MELIHSNCITPDSHSVPITDILVLIFYTLYIQLFNLCLGPVSTLTYVLTIITFLGFPETNLLTTTEPYISFAPFPDIFLFIRNHIRMKQREVNTLFHIQTDFSKESGLSSFDIVKFNINMDRN